VTNSNVVIAKCRLERRREGEKERREKERRERRREEIGKTFECCV